MKYALYKYNEFHCKKKKRKHQTLDIYVILFYWHFFEHGDIRYTV